MPRDRKAEGMREGKYAENPLIALFCFFSLFFILHNVSFALLCDDWCQVCVHARKGNGKTGVFNSK
jgi:hypothetical protein